MLGANWKTTVSGIISAFFAFIVFNKDFLSHHLPSEAFSWLEIIANFAAAGGLVSLGIAAKDKNVTGGTKQNDVA